jgi:signal transduction histidine kinase
MSIGANFEALGVGKASTAGPNAVAFALAIAAWSGILIAFEHLGSVKIDDPGARAAVETMITLSATFTAGLLVVNFQHTRWLPELLLLCALVGVAVTDFVYSALPVLAGGMGVESGDGARMGCELIVALAFAAAAFAPHKTIPGSRRRLVGAAVAAGIVTVALAELLEQQLSGSLLGNVSVGMAGATQDPVALIVDLASAAALIVSALLFLGRRGRGDQGWGLLAGASLLLAGARLQYLAMPSVATGWLTPREGLRLAAYLLLLASAWRHYAATRRSLAHAAIVSERERIARDLHDGLAQDLACIAAQGQRLGVELGPDHPMVIAAKHALSASRGAIADLTASAAPSTEAALRLIADELEHRYGLQVEVRIEDDSMQTVDSCLDPKQRDHLVRIAREAIVNAAVHGTARNVDVVLVHKGKDLVMRISDDGRGISDADRSGYGLRTMRARAASLGGQLSARPGPHGGTDLELLVS